MSHIVLIECTDQKGLIANITNTIFSNDLNIIRNWEFVDQLNNHFFMRTHIEGLIDINRLKGDLSRVLPSDASIVIKSSENKKAVILATKEAHCLGDLLVRCWHGALAMDIQAVISNHNVLKDLVDRFDIPFYFISTEGLERDEHEKRIMSVLQQYDPDIIVLAKYMRVLSQDFLTQTPQKIINIHHSFLPAFIGSKPYHQAYERGVKIIGATSHFVTNKLDQGPIISQMVINVDHSHSPEEMAKAGQDVEKITLSKALRLVTEDRVFISGNRTIVFE